MSGACFLFPMTGSEGLALGEGGPLHLRFFWKKNAHPFQNSFIWDQHSLYVSAGLVQKVWCLLGVLELVGVRGRAGPIVFAALLSMSAVHQDRWVHGFPLVQESVFLGHPRHRISQGMPVFQQCLIFTGFILSLSDELGLQNVLFLQVL